MMRRLWRMWVEERCVTLPEPVCGPQRLRRSAPQLAAGASDLARGRNHRAARPVHARGRRRRGGRGARSGHLGLREQAGAGAYRKTRSLGGGCTSAARSTAVLARPPRDEFQACAAASRLSRDELFGLAPIACRVNLSSAKQCSATLPLAPKEPQELPSHTSRTRGP